MKKSFFVFTSLVVVQLTQAKTDYSLCSDYIRATNDNIAKTGFAFPFVLNKDTGEVETINYNFNLKTSKGIKDYSASNPNLSLVIRAISRDDGGLNRIETETIIPDYSHGSVRKNIIKGIIKFDVKEGKCYPQIAHNEFSAQDQTFKSTIFDTQLCKSLDGFFENNQSLSQCFDPNSQKGKEVSEIFLKNGYDSNQLINSYGKITPVLARSSHSVEQKIVSGNLNAFDPLLTGNNKLKGQLMGINGGSPIISAYMILSDCFEKGLESTIRDEQLWKVPENSSNTLSSEKTSKQ